MRKITIGFSRPKARFQLFADAIMAVDGSNFSHAYVRFHMDSYDRDVVFQASGLKVNLIEWNNFQAIETVVKEFAIPTSNETQLYVVQFAIDNLGAPYDIAGIVDVAAEKFAKLFGKKIKPPVSQNGYYCSELVAHVLEDFFAAKLTTDQVKRMTPTDVYNYLLANPVEA